MNSHSQDMFFDQQVGSRSPGSHRQQHQTLNRQNNRQPLDAYNNMSSSTFLIDDQAGRFESTRFDRATLGMQGGGGGDFYGIGSTSWNPSAFASGPLPGANAFNFGTLGRMGKTTNRGRTNLPNTWLDPQAAQMSPIGGFGGLGIDNSQLRSHNFAPDPEDDLIPTAIVIKNIPFAVKKEQLVDVMNDLNLPLPYAFNYHFDNGVFRGLAFANFTSPEETAQVISALNHYELQGRKLRVEYKKMLPLQERERIEREKRERRGQLEEQHRPMNAQSLNNQHSMSSLSSHIAANSPSPISAGMGGQAHKPEVDLNDPETLQFYNQLFTFKSDDNREALIFPSNLSPAQRRVVHTLAHNLSLYHSSRGTGDQRQVHVTKVPQGNSISPPIPQLSTFHDPSRRVLSRAATTDFNETRGAESFYSSLRTQQSGGYLGIPDSPGAFASRSELRAAKSHADLRSYTPSPVPSSASFPTHLQTNAARHQEAAAQGTSAVAGASGLSGSAALSRDQDDHTFLNGGSFGNMSLGTNIGTNIAPGPTRGSPRTLRNMYWDNPQGSSTGPIGSNRGFTLNNHNDNSRDRNPQMPIRQPSIPSERGGSAFSRSRQNGHQTRGSDETRHSQPEIIHE